MANERELLINTNHVEVGIIYFIRLNYFDEICFVYYMPHYVSRFFVHLY